MKIRNEEIKLFGDFLLRQEANGRLSRLRIRFIKMLDERAQQIGDERVELLKQFAILNDDGSIKSKENGMAEITEENAIAYQREYRDLMTEEWVIDETQERKDMLLAVKDLVLNSQETFSGSKAIEYDRWCEIVEGIEYAN